METSEHPVPGSRWSGAVLEIRERTGSTMDDARVLARSGAPSGSAVVAGFQEAGRGRVPGRTWISPPWESLLATVILRKQDMPFALHQLPLRAGVAAARAVQDAAGCAVQVKWPNDLVAQGRKLAGILCEAAGDTAFVGMGVNCLQESFPPGLAMPAIALQQACGRAVPPRALLPFILDALHVVMTDETWRAALNSRLYGRGETMTVDLVGAGVSVRGVVDHVDGEGRLVLILPNGRREAITQGEIRSAP